MATSTQTPAALALYHFEGCPYCELVRDVIDELRLDVELRDIRRDPTHRDTLLAARGRQTVPVLEVTAADGATSLMPESRDIAHWLRERYEAGDLASLTRDDG